MSYYSEQLHGYGVDIEELELPDKMRWAIRLSTRRQLCHGLKIRHCSLVI